MTPETRELVQAQLVGLRATIGALQAQVVALETTVAQEPETPTAPTGCQHQDVENVGTFGLPEWQCQHCKQIVEPPS